MSSRARAPFPLLCALTLLAAPAAFAGPGQRAAAATDEAVQDILAGRSVPAAVSRIQYAGGGEQASDSLVRAASHPLDDRRRQNVSFALGELATPEAEPVLLRFLRDHDGSVRMNGLVGLRRIKSGRVEAISPLLRDKSMAVRREAARALSASQRRHKVGKLIAEAAKVEGEIDARAAMLIALGETGDRKMAAPLKSFLAHSSETTRFAAARGLCLLGDKEGDLFAQRLLGAEDGYERRRGLSLYEGAPLKSAGPILRPLLNDPDKRVVAASARILHQAGEPRMIEYLVVSSYHAKSDEKLAYERELETLHVTDEDRRALLAKAGLK